MNIVFRCGTPQPRGRYRQATGRHSREPAQPTPLPPQPLPPVFKLPNGNNHYAPCFCLAGSHYHAYKRGHTHPLHKILDINPTGHCLHLWDMLIPLLVQSPNPPEFSVT